MNNDGPRAARSAQPESSAHEPFRFSGCTADYFGIWLVNILLSILTLGIWSAWAKVRTLRYFYGNTWVAGGNFDFTATGLTILIGRIIVLVFFGVLSLASLGLGMVVPVLGNILPSLILIFLVPWAAIRSLRFNARHTVWRNVTLDYQGSYGQAFVAFVLMPLIATISLGLLAPFAAKVTGRTVINCARLGTARFETDASLGKLYKAFLIAILTGIAVVAVLASIASVLSILIYTLGGASHTLRDNAAVLGTLGMATVFSAGIALAVFVAGTVYRMEVRNILINGSVLNGRHRFSSTFSGIRVAWIVASNTILVVLTLGLMFPWARVRMWRYQTSCLAALPSGSLDEFVQAQSEAGNAFGSEYLDLSGGIGF